MAQSTPEYNSVFPLQDDEKHDSMGDGIQRPKQINHASS